MIGIFGGTFDPIHYGHLNLAIRLAEIHQLAEVWFIPARYSPFKTEHQSSSIEKRVKMTELAIEEILHFRLVDIETKRKGPSYTIDTLRTLVQEKQYDFRLLLGMDAVQSFNQWKEPEEIVKLAPPLIACRSFHDLHKEIPHEVSLFQELQKGMTQIPIMEISSTEIRERVRKGLYCGHLLPLKVMDFIIQNRLYL